MRVQSQSNHPFHSLALASVLPEMQETAKGQQWYFGMKAHIAVDGKSKLIHTVLVAGANVADALALRHLLHGKGTRVWGDQASRGQKCGGTHSAGLHQPALSLGQPDR
jgi:IS5 family transposase